MVHFSVIRVKGSPSYDFDACGDILAMAKAVGVMTENMRTDRCDNTQCDEVVVRETLCFGWS